MTDIPNTSKSPYYLRRMKSRPERSSSSSAPVSDYSLRSIPAWDPSYLGSSLLAKRIRKTLASVEASINAVATGGVDYNLLEQMVNTVLAGMNLEGLNEALQAVIDAIAGEAGATAADVAAEIQRIAARLTDGEGEVAALKEALRQVVDVLTILEVGSGTLTPEQAAQITEALTLAQGVVNILGGKPEGGATLADVAAVFGNLGAAFEAQIAAAIGEVGPMIFQAVQSQTNALPERIRLNTRSGKVVIEGSDLSGPNKPVTLDIEVPFGGSLTVNDKRVLTTDDNNALLATINELRWRTIAVEEENATLRGELAAHITKNDEQHANLQTLSEAVQTHGAATRRQIVSLRDVLGQKSNATDDDVRINLIEAISEAINETRNEFQQVAAEILDYAISTFAEKGIEDVIETLATKAELALYAKLDALSEYAKRDDYTQQIIAGSITIQAVKFAGNNKVLAPLDFLDYGNRLAFIDEKAATMDEEGIVVLRTDLTDIINPKDGS